jgi:hypothetical protein
MSRKRLAEFSAIMIIASGLGWASEPSVPTQGPIKAAPVMEKICVETIQNLSHQPVSMEGFDDELVAQLQKIGFQAKRVSAPDPKQCDATINAELVDITGRSRKTARVDFRLTLAGEEPPRMSASAQGRSSKSAPMVVSVPSIMSNFRPMGFASSQRQKDTTGVAREAVVAALADQAHQIKVAYQRGLPPWLPEARERTPSSTGHLGPWARPTSAAPF